MTMNQQSINIEKEKKTHLFPCMDSYILFENQIYIHEGNLKVISVP